MVYGDKLKIKMKKIKTYNIFLESNDNSFEDTITYSIYEWMEDLKRAQWGKINKRDISTDLKKWTEHFIGDGYFDRINNLVDSIYDALRKVDVDTINDRMYDVYDNIPSSKEKWTMCSILYGDYEDYDKPNSSGRYNGILSVPNPNNENSKTDMILHILKAIVYPTLLIGYPGVPIRTTDDEKFVTDKKYQCVNFNINNYSLLEGDVIPNGETGRRSTTTIGTFDISKKRKYSVDKVVDMYRPGIFINIGGYHDSTKTGKMNLKSLEADIDEVLPSILPVLDYEEVIFDMYRPDRRFDDNTDIHEYTLKILLTI